MFTLIFAMKVEKRTKIKRPTRDTGTTRAYITFLNNTGHQTYYII